MSSAYSEIRTFNIRKQYLFLVAYLLWGMTGEYWLQPPDNDAEVRPMVEGLLAGEGAAGHGQLKRLVHAGREAGLHFIFVNNLAIFSYNI